MNAVKMMRYLLLVGVSYFKRVALILPLALLAVIVPMARDHFTTGNIPIIGFMCFVFINFVVMFPLSAMDKVPQVFAFLPQRKADVVRGVYLLLTTVLAVVLGIGLAACAIGVQGTAGGICAMALTAGLVLVSVSQGVLIPCILRFGYAKAQPAIFASVFGLSLLVGMVFKHIPDTIGQSSWKWLLDFSHPVLPVLILVLLAAVILFISYLVSLRLYRQKDI
ncbi:ABC-2 transporter permease [Ethanoligenens sp.]|uniref:ABC-2 transporter permease n=1 Tax=Ethanoligenens sp. TaxID=2099655 RepID=UPI0039EC5099